MNAYLLYTRIMIYFLFLHDLFIAFRKSELPDWRLRILNATCVRAYVQFHLRCNHENVSWVVLYRRRLYDHASCRRVLVSPHIYGVPFEDNAMARHGGQNAEKFN